jgi:hypothetical protein
MTVVSVSARSAKTYAMRRREHDVRVKSQQSVEFFPPRPALVVARRMERSGPP